MNNLIELSEYFEELNRILNEQDGELTPEDENHLQLLSKELSKCTDQAVDYLKGLEDIELIASNKIKEIQHIKKINSNKIERFKQYVSIAMTKMDKRKIAGQLHTISKRKPVKSVEIINQDAIPIEYKKVSFTIDKAKIKQDLKNGIDVPGAKLVDGKQGVVFK